MIVDTDDDFEKVRKPVLIARNDLGLIPVAIDAGGIFRAVNCYIMYIFGKIEILDLLSILWRETLRSHNELRLH